MEADEPGTLVRLKARRQQVLSPLLKRYSGRLVKMMGDSVLVEFGSAVNAAQCALALQAAMNEANAAEPDLPPIQSVGINVGDVMVEGGDLYGDGVNIAARLESIAEPGAIYVSGKVQDELRGKMKVDYDDLGDVALKNIAVPVRVFQIGAGGARRTIEPGVSLRPATMPALAILPFKNLGTDRAGDSLSEVVTEEILTEVSRFKSLRIVARRAIQESGARPAGARTPASEAGADFVAEGSVRQSAEVVRVTVQLSEAATGNRIWSERYDIKPAEIDRVINAIVTSLEQQMVSIAASMARLKPASNWTAYDYLLQGATCAMPIASRMPLPISRKRRISIRSSPMPIPGWHWP
jgi:TolB-like protein